MAFLASSFLRAFVISQKAAPTAGNPDFASRTNLASAISSLPFDENKVTANHRTTVKQSKMKDTDDTT